MTGIFRKWWFWGLAVLLIVAAGITYWRWPRKYTLTVSRETTVLLGPVNPDGTVNYVAALNQMYGEGVTPENNAAVLLIQAAGPELLPEMVRARVLKRLGMRALPKSGSYFVRLQDFVSGLHTGEGMTSEGREELDERGRKELEDAIASPWSASDYPTIARWLKASEGPLSLVISASRRRRYFIPLIPRSNPPGLFDAILPNLGFYRSMGQALAARAMLKAGEAQIEDAISDLLAAHRLARLVGQDPTLMGRIVGLAVEAVACEGSSGLASSGKLTAAQARDFLAALKALPPLASPVPAVDQSERFSSLDKVAVLARESWKRGAAGSAGEDVRQIVRDIEINADWTKMVQKVNYWYDRQVAAMRKEPYSERREATASCTDAFIAYTVNVSGAGNRYRLRELFGGGSDTSWAAAVRRDPIRAVVSTIVPILGRSRLFHDKAVMHFRLTKVALALAACKAEKGVYPAKLAELEPEYFKKVPQDLFAEGALTYRRVGKGYLLYSVGENMKDDGGRNNEREKDRKEKFDDIAVRAE